MSPIQAILWPITIGALALLAWKGGRLERLTAAVLVLNVLAPFFLQDLIIGQTRWALAIVSVALSAFLMTMAVIGDRWWLLGAAGVQITSSLTYAVGAVAYDLWTAVGLRRALWVFLMAACVAGAVETRLAHKARRFFNEGNDLR
ncbi:hypothetical protein Q0812_02465 [Brevundimonas sp. 2R-24]|uniref:Uncharacterized protein n=1 Tax=Peiella sedimenti TaxID=3061083 RepID=A0ABT8SI97_9CAUL|nr:hypothetical protein [Caulobacteraceae bacterium XZ-24]